MVEEPGDDEVKQKNGILKSAWQYTNRRVKAMCTKKTLYKRLPILSWLPRYNAQDALGDLMAGITVGLTVIPQSLAYSSVAGLPPQVCKRDIYRSLLDETYERLHKGLRSLEIHFGTEEGRGQIILLSMKNLICIKGSFIFF